MLTPLFGLFRNVFDFHDVRFKAPRVRRLAYSKPTACENVQAVQPCSGVPMVRLPMLRSPSSIAPAAVVAIDHTPHAPPQSLSIAPFLTHNFP